MTSKQEQKNKIIKSFCVVGLNENMIQKYKEEEAPPFIQDMDVFIKNFKTNSDIFTTKDKSEKWIRVIKENNVWLRIRFSKEYHNPITDLRIHDCEYESPEYLLLEKKISDDQYRPLMVTIYKDQENSESQNKDETNDKTLNDKNKADQTDKNNKSGKDSLGSFPIISEFQHIKPYNDFYVKVPSELDVKKILKLPNSSQCAVLLISRKLSSLPLKDIIIQRRQNQNFYTFGVIRHKSPYSYKYIPEIIDQYPIKDSSSNNGVPLFCFPEGISIQKEYRMPRWFNFVLTDELGKRTYGSTVVFLEDLENKLIESFVPIFEEEDEKKKKKIYFVQKAICILSNYPFNYNCLLFLKQLYRIQIASKSIIPLERAICAFVDSLYLPKNDTMLQFRIGEEKLNFYSIPNYGKLWDTDNSYLEVLFRVLSFDQIVTAWQGLLLEKNLFLLCSSKATLFCVAHGLVNLLFPFKWIHVFVPILPEKLMAFIESPVPSIIGISFSIDLNDLPPDSLILNINKNRFENYLEKLPKMPVKVNLLLQKKLSKLKEKYGVDNPVNADLWMDYQDEVFPALELENHIKIDPSEIRDVFYDTFIHLFKNYPKYFNWDNKNKSCEDSREEMVSFITSAFLKDHGCQDDNNSFLALFCQTALFNQFISNFQVMKPDGATYYFLESIEKSKKGRGKNEVYLPQIIPSKEIHAPEIYIKDLNKQTFFHKSFPKLDPNLYIQTKSPEKIKNPKFIYYKDEWCFEPQKLKKKEWAKYFYYAINEIWFHFFSYVIHFQEDNEASLLMDYAIFLLHDLINNKRISPTRNLFSKIFKACGRTSTKYIKQILSLVHKVNKSSKFSRMFHNDYLSGLYALTETIGSNTTITIQSTNSYLNITAIRQSILAEILSNDIDIEAQIKNIIFITSKICPSCLMNNKKLDKISIEEILAGFSQDISKTYTSCPICRIKIEPYIYYLRKNQHNLKVNKFKLMSPYRLYHEINNIIMQKGEIVFYQNIPTNDLLLNIYLNLIFYFQLFDFPLFVLYIKNNNKQNSDELKFEIEENTNRRSLVKRKKSGISVSPDRKNKSLDTSSDNRSVTGAENSSVATGKSSLSNLSAMENEVWQNIKESTKIEEILFGEKITEDSSSKIKDMKNVLNNIIQHWIASSKEKLDNFLNEIENERQNPLANKQLLKEKEENSEIGNNDMSFITNLKKISVGDKNEKSESRKGSVGMIENMLDEQKSAYSNINSINEVGSANFGGINEIKDSESEIRRRDQFVEKNYFYVSEKSKNDTNKNNLNKQNAINEIKNDFDVEKNLNVINEDNSKDDKSNMNNEKTNSQVKKENKNHNINEEQLSRNEKENIFHAHTHTTNKNPLNIPVSNDNRRRSDQKIEHMNKENINIGDKPLNEKQTNKNDNNQKNKKKPNKKIKITVQSNVLDDL